METQTHFAERTSAGKALARSLLDLADADPLVMGLPRGGVPVAREVAEALDAPLDVIVVRKIGAPGHREFALGAIGEGGIEVLDQQAMNRVGVDRDALFAVLDEERTELRRRVERYRGSRLGEDVTGRTVIVVDDGIATGRTARAAAQVLRARDARRVVLAVPVASPRAVAELQDVYDEVVALHAPAGFMAVGTFYGDFSQTTDEDVERILAARGRGRTAPDRGAPRSINRHVTVDVGDAVLQGDLVVPAGATGVVIFAHGSGSSRHSPRNQQVASVLHDAGLASLLLDLLTEAEGGDRRNVFDIELLARRVVGAVDWAEEEEAVATLPIGLFGASTGAAAALEAAANRPEVVRAVVSRGGRVDLAQRMDRVRAPLMMVIGGDDRAVLDMNRDAATRLTVDHRFEIIEGAGHLFEGPGELEEVAAHAVAWFQRHFAPR